ncbi:hypothetical protein COP2_003374 [Malus domestica]
MLPCHIHIIAKTNVIKYMLAKPMLIGRIWEMDSGIVRIHFSVCTSEGNQRASNCRLFSRALRVQGEIINILGTLEMANILIPPSKAILGRE